MNAEPRSMAEMLAGQRLPALDGLRTVAIVTVMVHHFGISPFPGDLGVSGFFVLSGFLITWLLRKEYQATGRISLRDFYMRRVLRIFPAYYVFLFAVLAVGVTRRHVWPGLMTAGFTYLVNYYNAFTGHPESAISHAWSLAIEEQFYLVWPLLLAVCIGRGDAAVRRLLTVAILCVAAWRSFLYLVIDVGPAYVYNAFDTRFDCLAVGCLLALVLEMPSAQRILRRGTDRAWYPVVTIALLLLSRMAIGPAWHHSAGFTVDAVFMGILIAQVLQLHAVRPWSLLDHPAVRYVGVISYPLYLYHKMADSIVQELGAPLPVTIVLAFGLSFLAAAASYHLVERPFLRLKARFASAG